jgi:hypothetical protein
VVLVVSKVLGSRLVEERRRERVPAFGVVLKNSNIRNYLVKTRQAAGIVQERWRFLVKVALG